MPARLRSDKQRLRAWAVGDAAASSIAGFCHHVGPALFGDKKELARSPRCLQAAGLPVVTNVGHLVRRSVTKWPPEPLSTYPRAQRSLLRPSRRWVCGQGTSAGTAQREGLKPEGVETWDKARCVARKPVPGMTGASMAIGFGGKARVRPAQDQPKGHGVRCGPVLPTGSANGQ